LLTFHGTLYSDGGKRNNWRHGKDYDGVGPLGAKNGMHEQKDDKKQS